MSGESNWYKKEREKMTPELRELDKWLYECTKNNFVAVLILGVMQGEATENPEISYIEALRRARERIVPEM